MTIWYRTVPRIPRQRRDAARQIFTYQADIACTKIAKRREVFGESHVLRDDRFVPSIYNARGYLRHSHRMANYLLVLLLLRAKIRLTDKAAHLSPMLFALYF